MIYDRQLFIDWRVYAIGMKRKLCVAIALIGDPEVVLLDEPSAGLDPVSRRNLWNVILRTMSNRAVVLTTHSMEEAEALCFRIGIMVNGQLQALGNKQHLKAKLGGGYELVVKLSSTVNTAEKQINDNPLHLNEALDRFSTFIVNLFPQATFVSDNGGLVTFNIPKENMDMGKIFTSLEENKTSLNIENYSVAQPTLEQVFIRTVQTHTPLPQNSTAVPSVQRLRDSMAGAPVEAVIEPPIIIPLNACGCTPKFVKIAAIINFLLFILFLALNFATASALLFAISVIFFLIFVIFFMICCCPCCKPPKLDDE